LQIFLLILTKQGPRLSGYMADRWYYGQPFLRHGSVIHVLLQHLSLCRHL